MAAKIVLLPTLGSYKEQPLRCMSFIKLNHQLARLNFQIMKARNRKCPDVLRVDLKTGDNYP